MKNKKRCFYKSVMVILMIILFLPSAFAYDTREELRTAFNALNDVPKITYVEEPSVLVPYEPGRLSEDVIVDVVGYLNFVRSVAALKPVEPSLIMTHQAQHAAVLLASEKTVSHEAEISDGMPDEFYAIAHLGTISSNLACFNWMRDSILREAVNFFIMDGGEENLGLQGHRRWFLNPEMAHTGVGLANDSEGRAYIAMYATDMADVDTDWKKVCWPTEGVFPAEFMNDDLAWTIMLNPITYDVAESNIRITLTEDTLGLSYVFPQYDPASGDFFTIGDAQFAGSPCIIFRPDLSMTDNAYEQNRNWHVDVNGLKRKDGTTERFSYDVHMVSLYPKDTVAVELDETELSMKVGSTVILEADVIPTYADDLTVTWSSSDDKIAKVDVAGNVTAVSNGICEIHAETVNGRTDVCVIHVDEGGDGE